MKENDSWIGWKYYCNHRVGDSWWARLRHRIACPLDPVESLLTDPDADCAVGCGRTGDPSSPNYWRLHLDAQDFVDQARVDQ